MNEMPEREASAPVAIVRGIRLRLLAAVIALGAGVGAVVVAIELIRSTLGQ